MAGWMKQTSTIYPLHPQDMSTVEVYLDGLQVARLLLVSQQLPLRVGRLERDLEEGDSSMAVGHLIYTKT